MNVFQFHEGPIKTRSNTQIMQLQAEFQFHEGPIKTGLHSHILGGHTRFNSMKVRLKLAKNGRNRCKLFGVSIP